MKNAKGNVSAKRRKAFQVDEMIDVLRYRARGYSQGEIAKTMGCTTYAISDICISALQLMGQLPVHVARIDRLSETYKQRVHAAVVAYCSMYGALKLPPFNVECHNLAIKAANAKKTEQGEKAEVSEAESVSEPEQVTFSEAEPDTTDDKGWLTTSTLISVEAHGVYADVAGSEQALTVTVGTVQFQMSAAQLKGFASELLKVVEALGVSE